MQNFAGWHIHNNNNGVSLKAPYSQNYIYSSHQVEQEVLRWLIHSSWTKWPALLSSNKLKRFAHSSWKGNHIFTFTLSDTLFWSVQSRQCQCQKDFKRVVQKVNLSEIISNLELSHSVHLSRVLAPWSVWHGDIWGHENILSRQCWS